MNKRSCLTILYAFIAILVTTFPLWTNNVLYLDDNSLALAHIRDGFWGPSQYYLSVWGLYRIGYTFLISMAFALYSHIWIVRLMGIVGHVCTCLFAAFLWRRLGNHIASTVLLLMLLLFFPYSLEAVGWAAAIPEYMIAPLMLFCGASIAVFAGERHPRVQIFGGVVMGAAMFFHEQTAPFIVILGLAIAYLFCRRRIAYLTAAFSPVFVATLLIAVTAGSNERLSGPRAAHLSCLFYNAHFIWTELLRTTPFCSPFYSTGMFTWWHALGYGALGACAAFVMLGRHVAAAPETAEKSIRRPVWIMVGSLCCWFVAVSPIMLNQLPWHTPRVVYIPFFAVAWLLSAMAEIIIRKLRGPLGVYIVSLLCIAVASWGAIALNAEARAYDGQLNVNTSRYNSFVELLRPEEDLTSNSLLVIAGYPYSDVDRPLMGEHIISISPWSVRSCLERQFGFPYPPPRFDVRGGWEGVYLASDDHLALRRDYITKHSVNDPDKFREGIEPTFIVWVDGKWEVQRKGESIRSIKKLTGIVPRNQ